MAGLLEAISYSETVKNWRKEFHFDVTSKTRGHVKIVFTPIPPQTCSSIADFFWREKGYRALEEELEKLEIVAGFAVESDAFAKVLTTRVRRIRNPR